ncbi:hypothetical protein RI367_005702 [Sorochytrium milnesiophthora]
MLTLRAVESFPKDPFPEKLLPITHKLMGSNIVFSNGDVWRRHRKIAHPAFSKRWHTDIFADVLRTFVDVLDQRVGTPVDPNAYMQRLTLDALSTAAFGESFNSLRNPHSDLVNTYNQVVNDQLHPVFRFLPFLQLIPIPFIRRMSQSVDKFNAYLHDIIDRRTVQVNALRASGAATPAHDLLAKMIEANLDDEDGSFSQEDLRANLAVFFIAGHDTTASALATSLYLMGMHPAVQKKARQEVLNECGASVSGEYHLPTTEQQARLEYLTLVVKETLRMYPPLPTVLFRRSTTAVELEPGLVLPAGTRVHFDMLCLHRDTSIWGDDAMQFRPERWETMTFDHDDGKDDAGSHYRRDSGVDVLDPTHYNRERRHSHSHGMTGNVPVLPAQHNYSWLPFGAGPRICLGQAFSLMEIRVVLAVILQRYEWRVVGDERALRGELDMSQTNMLHPLNVQLEFTPKMVSQQLQAVYVLDMVFSTLIKALQRLQSLAYIVSFASGIVSACLTFGMSIPRITDTGNAVTLATPIRINDFVNILQLYLQGMVIIQRLHIINYVRFGHSAEGILGDIAHRWMEILWSLVAIMMCYVAIAWHAQSLAYYAGTLWLVSVFLMDLVVSLITFGRMLRMLNNTQNSWQWYWTTLRSKDDPTQLPDKVQVDKSQTLSGKGQSAGGKRIKTSLRSKRMVVRTWTLVMLSLIMGGSFFLFAWCGYPDSDVFYAPYRVAWVFVSIWQRGGLLYFQAIKHVQTTNFPSQGSIMAGGGSQNVASGSAPL